MFKERSELIKKLESLDLTKRQSKKIYKTSIDHDFLKFGIELCKNNPELKENAFKFLIEGQEKYENMLVNDLESLAEINMNNLSLSHNEFERRNAQAWKFYEEQRYKRAYSDIKTEYGFTKIHKK